ncbi:hypothetical protein [Desulfuromonas thiophila]|uniref:hypothetical protein n=1 Tax=Desulfuromonas thiophila TaxID=57664 RepID=UPI0024A83DBB|nr:hypothetical protein [Desulfuromonas thiophila]
MNGPWSEGSKELLQHATEHLSQGGDFDRRIAMISTDNAVELMIKTFLSLPKRIRGSAGPSRKEIEESNNSFPSLLDLFEKHGGDRLDGVSLEEIEWYHRIRNEIYHSGHGVTVELSRVETYLELASILFENLFRAKLELKTTSKKQEKIGRFLEVWVRVESTFRTKRPNKPSGEYAYYWNRQWLESISPRAKNLWEELHDFRNILVHNYTPLESKDFDRPIEEANELLSILEKIA